MHPTLKIKRRPYKITYVALKWTSVLKNRRLAHGIMETRCRDWNQNKTYHVLFLSAELDQTSTKIRF